MNFVFRVDSSIEIGAGHVMRCLALADGLRARGHEVSFVCREHPGNLIKLIEKQRYCVLVLNVQPKQTAQLDSMYAKWLGVPQKNDAYDTLDMLNGRHIDWLVVDHYGIDETWEKIVNQQIENIFVIDDLADRNHCSTMLMDQTFLRKEGDYKVSSQPDCKYLMGSRYALLRPEFASLRARIDPKRKTKKIEKILVSFGGVDKDNYTSKVLAKLNECKFSDPVQIIVVIGATCPWINQIEQIIDSISLDVELSIGTDDMASLIAENDLAIGAAGSSSWERCALGLPTIQIITAANQKQIAKNLASVGAVKTIEDLNDLPGLLTSAPAWLEEMSAICSQITDGKGVERVVYALENQY